jgi:cytochrome c-type biogenesis protein
MLAAMIGPFAEAVRATVQPCTFLLIVPTTAAVVAARATWQALVGGTAAAVVGGWILADNSFLLEGAWLRLSAVAVVLAMVAFVMPFHRLGARFAGTASPWVRSGMVAFVVLVASQWWRPCVGDELGTILSAADGSLAGQLVPMAAYMLGAMVPIAAVVAIRYAFEPGPGALTVCASGGAFMGVLVAAFLVAGRHESVVVTLTRWTLE